MKRLVLSLTILFCAALVAQAQSKKELKAMLERDLAAYKRFTLAMNFDSSLQYMPPKMFEIIPRDSLVSTMHQAFNNEYMHIEMTGLDFKPSEKIKIKKAGAYHWALVPYDGSMRLVLQGEEQFKKMLVPLMKSQFGSQNVEEKDGGLNIRMKNKHFIAFKDPASPIWSIIEDKRNEKGREGKTQQMLFENVVPEEVRKAMEKG